MENNVTSLGIGGFESYAQQFSISESPVLKALREETGRSIGRAHMISGPLQGALLQSISKLLRPKKILEIGTFTGYSAICLAQGLEDVSVLHTIELDRNLEEIANRYFREAGLQEKIVRHFGKAQEIIPTLDGPFDLVFLDADKKGYAAYLEQVLPKMAEGGVMLADNVLFKGEVLKPEELQSPIAAALHRFNQKVSLDPRVEVVILPLRDGISLIRKLPLKP